VHKPKGVGRRKYYGPVFVYSGVLWLRFSCVSIAFRIALMLIVRYRLFLFFIHFMYAFSQIPVGNP
jgi:hypothetical protein